MKRKTRFGWFEFIVGILMVIFGVLAFANPGNTITVVVRCYAAVAILSGIRDVVFCCRTERVTGFLPTVSLTAGIVSLMAGIMVFAYPGAGSMLIAIVMPIWMISRSIFQLSSSRALLLITSPFHFALSMITAIMGLILGIVMIFTPALSLTTASYIIGIYMIVAGVNSICIAFSKTGFFM